MWERLDREAAVSGIVRTRGEDGRGQHMLVGHLMHSVAETEREGECGRNERDGNGRDYLISG